MLVLQATPLKLRSPMVLDSGLHHGKMAAGCDDNACCCAVHERCLRFLQSSEMKKCHYLSNPRHVYEYRK